MSKGEGSPSFLRTPTVSTPQWTNTARAAGAAACSITASTRGSDMRVAVHGREQADGVQARSARICTRSGGPSSGFTMK